jgi:hypothetical protein
MVVIIGSIITAEKFESVEFTESNGRRERCIVLHKGCRNRIFACSPIE